MKKLEERSLLMGRGEGGVKGVVHIMDWSAHTTWCYADNAL